MGEGIALGNIHLTFKKKGGMVFIFEDIFFFAQTENNRISIFKN